METLRYYRRRRLLAIPHSGGGVRRYPMGTIIRFKRSQDLGFSREEIRELMRLEQGGSRRAIRKIAEARLSSIRENLLNPEELEASI